MKRDLLRFLIVFSAHFLVISCGVDEYAYIYPIPQENISTSLNRTATVRIPGNNAGTVFTHFTILYRIYLSGVVFGNPSPGDFSTINPALLSHYNAINAYSPSSDRVFSVSLLESLLRNRGYKELRFQGQEIEALLDSGVFNRQLFFNFGSAHGTPTMTVMNGNNPVGSAFRLLRSEELSLPPQDDYYFLYSEKLLNGDDIEKNGSASGYAYAAMFIIAVGLNTEDYSLIYSNPTLIHVFPVPARGI